MKTDLSSITGNNWKNTFTLSHLADAFIQSDSLEKHIAIDFLFTLAAWL